MKNYLKDVMKRFKALNGSQKALLAGGLLVLVSVLTGVSLMGGSGEPAPASTPAVTQEAPEAAYDPYAYYLEHNPDPNLILSPQDAATRALLGCDYSDEMVNSFPVDKVLREAYGPTGICG